MTIPTRSRPVRAKISAIGTYLPPRVLTNADLEKMVDTSNEWIMERVGIRTRHIVDKGVATSDLAVEAVKRLQAAGCRHFFVATWAEAKALMPWPSDLELVVLHGVQARDIVTARKTAARPVLNSPEQVARWEELVLDVGASSACRLRVLAHPAGGVLARQLDSANLMSAGTQLGHQQLPAPAAVEGTVDQAEDRHRGRHPSGRQRSHSGRAR